MPEHVAEGDARRVPRHLASVCELSDRQDIPTPATNMTTNAHVWAFVVFVGALGAMLARKIGLYLVFSCCYPFAGVAQLVRA